MGLQECDFDHQPSGKGGTRSPPAKSKVAASGPQNGLPLGFWHSKQLSLNKFFNLSTPSLRKVDDGEKRKEKKKERK